MKKTKVLIQNRRSNNKPILCTEKSLRYRIEVEILPKSGILRISDEYLAALNTKGEISKKRMPFLEKVKKPFAFRMEGQAHPYTMTNI
jgi:hypothetical protein